MNDQETPEGEALPSDANASQAVPTTDVESAQPGSEAESSPAAAESDKPKPSKDGRDIRIDELTRRLRETERRYDRVLRLAEERNTREPEPVKPEVRPEAPKTLKDFNYDEPAFAAYVRAQVAKDAARDVRAELEQGEAQKAADKRKATYYKRAAEFAKTHEDFADIAGSAPVSQAIQEMVMELDEGPLVALHLGNNHELSEELSGLSERAAAIRLGRLEERLIAERAKLKAKPVSQAPPPAPKIEATDPGDLDNDTPNSAWSDARYAKWRKNQIAQRK